MQLPNRGLIVLFVWLITVSFAQAHSRLVETYEVGPRDDNVGNKVWPCGPGSTPTTATVLAPGTTIELQWEEAINHHGWWHFHLSTNGDAGFGKLAGDNVEITVLKQKIADLSDGQRQYTTTITMPNIECNNCVLQLVQEMEDKSKLTNELPMGIMFPSYFSCADIILSADAPSITTTTLFQTLVDDFTLLDTDFDGKLSESEALTVAESNADMFVRLLTFHDTDSDRKLTLNELNGELNKAPAATSKDSGGGGLGWFMLLVPGALSVYRLACTKGRALC